jgi:hypothetical protein
VDAPVVLEGSLEVECELRFGLIASLTLLVGGGDGVQLFGDHSGMLTACNLQNSYGRPTARLRYAADH